MLFRRPNQPRRGISPRLILAGVVLLIAFGGYWMKSSVNPVTGKKQHISLTPDQEIVLGLQAAPEVAQQFGGLSADAPARERVARVGGALVRGLPPEAGPYRYDFHLLEDDDTVNAFALPGGQIFITEALFKQLESEGQLAGVLGHEIGHVIGRHSAERMAKAELTQGIIGAVGVAASDMGQGAYTAQQMAAMVGEFVNMRYGRDDELESDKLGLRFMASAGYDPRAMVGVMRILEKASGGGKRPEFASTHPNPGRRIERIEEIIKEVWPGGVPGDLKP